MDISYPCRYVLYVEYLRKVDAVLIWLIWRCRDSEMAVCYV